MRSAPAWFDGQIKLDPEGLVLMDETWAKINTARTPALTALHKFVALSGSLVLGLAVSHRRLDAAESWTLSRIK